MILSKQESRAAEWVSLHRGRLSEIARRIKPPVSPQFVHLVLRGKRKSKDGMVERLLKRAGAPIE